MINLARLRKKIKFINHLEGKYLYGIPMTEDMFNEFVKDKEEATKDNTLFYKKYLFYPEDIYILGTTEIKSREVLDAIISCVMASGNRLSFTCFSGDHKRCLHNSPTVIHENLESSWNCLLEKFNNPEYLVILRFDTDEFSKFI